MANIQYRYSRIVDEIPVDEGKLFIMVSSIRENKSINNENGEVIKEQVESGPSYSIESDKPFDEPRASYELTKEEFDELIQLHQTNKKEFMYYKKG